MASGRMKSVMSQDQYKRVAFMSCQRATKVNTMRRLIMGRILERTDERFGWVGGGDLERFDWDCVVEGMGRAVEPLPPRGM